MPHLFSASGSTGLWTLPQGPALWTLAFPSPSGLEAPSALIISPLGYGKLLQTHLPVHSLQHPSTPCNTVPLSVAVASYFLLDNFQAPRYEIQISLTI